MNQVTAEQVRAMPYVEFMAFLNEVNRPPGGKTGLRMAIQNSFLDRQSKVLDVGCNTGYCTFEIAHLLKCQVVGVDISSEMIEAANQYREKDPLGDLTSFQVADGMRLPFDDDTFDMTFSGGSTAFIDDKQKAIAEYTRVTKSWGFVTDIHFFYHAKPPQELLDELNELLGINIQPWGYEYWDDLYRECGLENYYRHTQEVALVSDEEVERYARALAKEREVVADVEDVVVERLQESMLLFNRNHAYLSWGLFTNRKRPYPEQVALFE
jgi:SAM-dependent methyltransferase